ncbi:MAG TPA: phospholipase, partial [Stellaceae bacterium]|nr:phospholipase [Stellaceae bacterium]
MSSRQVLLSAAAIALLAPVAMPAPAAEPSPGAVAPASPSSDAAESAATVTPIKHLVVIFQENVSFDHYFATYPNA